MQDNRLYNHFFINTYCQTYRDRCSSLFAMLYFFNERTT